MPLLRRVRSGKPAPARMSPHTADGEPIVSQLHAMQAYIWCVPRSSNQAVVAQRSGTQSTNGDASGSFAAVATGAADLSATEDPRCYPQCLPPSRYWSVHITVIS